MNCKKCGNFINPGDLFCQKCGEKVESQSTQQPVVSSNVQPQMQQPVASSNVQPQMQQPVASSNVQPQIQQSVANPNVQPQFQNVSDFKYSAPQPKSNKSINSVLIYGFFGIVIVGLFLFVTLTSKSEFEKKSYKATVANVEMLMMNGMNLQPDSTYFIVGNNETEKTYINSLGITERTFTEVKEFIKNEYIEGIENNGVTVSTENKEEITYKGNSYYQQNLKVSFGNDTAKISIGIYDDKKNNQVICMVSSGNDNEYYNDFVKYNKNMISSIKIIDDDYDYNSNIEINKVKLFTNDLPNILEK